MTLNGRYVCFFNLSFYGRSSNLLRHLGEAPPAEAEAPEPAVSEATGESNSEVIPEPVTENVPEVLAEAAQEDVSEPVMEPAQDSMAAAAPEQPVVQAETSGKKP